MLTNEHICIALLLSNIVKIDFQALRLTVVEVFIQKKREHISFCDNFCFRIFYPVMARESMETIKTKPFPSIHPPTSAAQGTLYSLPITAER